MTRSQQLASAVDVEREVEVPPGPWSSAWLAAYALGLAYTSRSPRRCPRSRTTGCTAAVTGYLGDPAGRRLSSD